MGWVGSVTRVAMDLVNPPPAALRVVTAFKVFASTGVVGLGPSSAWPFQKAAKEG
jgi:hypothetical protein